MSRSDWRYTLEDDSTMIEDVGVVVKIYADDLEGDRHQRFVVQLNCNQTLLIVHNIDLVDRVHIRAGDLIKFKGEYEFNHRGGLVHWTHRDPMKKHESGWIKHAGRIYH